MEIHVSQRMRKTGELIENASCVADVGCDHAYTSMFLIETKKAKRVLAMDINKGPLAIANRNIMQYGFTDVIETRLSDGLKEAKPGEVDAVLIGGMGGLLIRNILDSAPEVLAHVNQLVLQPQSEQELLRKYLVSHDYVITKEEMLLEEGKYYVILRCVPKSVEFQKTDTSEYQSKEDFEYGKYLLINKHPVLCEFLQNKHRSLLNIQNQLKEKKNKSEKICNRMEEIDCECEYISKILDTYFK